jgi:hypothetical protein
MTGLKAPESPLKGAEFGIARLHNPGVNAWATEKDFACVTERISLA